MFVSAYAAGLQYVLADVFVSACVACLECVPRVVFVYAYSAGLK